MTRGQVLGRVGILPAGFVRLAAGWKPTLPCVLLAVASYAEPLTPILNEPGKIIMEERYDDESPELAAEISDRRKGKWLIKTGNVSYEDKALRLKPAHPSKAEDKSKTPTHMRAFIREAPQDNVISFRFKLVGTEGERKPPRFFYENGHYKIRITGGVDGVRLVIGKEAKAESDFKIEADKWYETMLEVRGDEAVARFADGPTLKAKDPKIKNEERKGVQIWSLCPGGMVIDDVVIREAK